MTINFIPWIINALMLVVAIFTYVHNKGKDNKKEIMDDGEKHSNINEQFIKVNMKLDTLCNTTQETRLDIKAMDKSIAEFDKRISVVEEKIKVINHRIEDVERKVK